MASSPNGNGKAPATDDSTQANESVVAASADNVDEKNKPTTGGSGGKSSSNPDPFKGYGDRPSFTSGGPKMGSLKASRASSVASPAADPSRREPLKANNPLSIPTAGGKPLGGKAMAERERRRSRFSADMSVDREGSSDPVTQKNTQANTVPQGNGEGSSKVQDGVVPEEGEKAADAPAAATDGTKEEEAGKDSNKAQVVEGSPIATGTGGAGAAPAVKERRGSTLDALKDKLKIGKKSK